jgi:hypothetical protein
LFVDDQDALPAVPVLRPTVAAEPPALPTGLPTSTASSVSSKVEKCPWLVGVVGCRKLVCAGSQRNRRIGVPS